MNSCEYIYIISSIAYTISQGKDIDEITFLGAFFAQLGDTLSTIAAAETLNKKREKY